MKTNLWFKRKIYGWGWYPCSWQGWAVTLAYILLVFAFSQTIDENSLPREVFFTFIFPLVLLTALLIKIAYKTGEKPRWSWGK
ncbi:hypothetical protein KA107_03250 [Candidatus Pacearchaeota archaeon]|nr:hypothetical protein [Candidatus Pacearchaeota archaeon]